MAASNSLSVLAPNLGLFLDRPPEAVPARGLVDGLNFRLKNGRIDTFNMGWSKFLATPLNGPVALIDNFFLSVGTQILIFATTTDLYRYDEGTGAVVFITPRYETGTVSITQDTAAVTGVGTAWSTNLKAGDAIHFGAASVTDPAAKFYTVKSVDSDTQLTLTANFAEATVSGVAYTARKLFGGTLDDVWSSDTFPLAQPTGKDLWFATNGGVDPVVSWDGQADQVTLETGLGFRCSSLFRFKDVMIYGNLTLADGTARPYSIANSDADTPTDVVNGIAGQFVVTDGVSPVLTMYDLGDTLAIYSDREIILAQFVGDPLIWIFRTAISGIGPVAPRLVADFGDFHEILASDGQYSFNGVGLEVIGTQVFREVLRQQDPTRINRALSHFDEEQGDLIWAVPLTTDGDTSGGPEVAYVEHYLEDTGPNGKAPISKRDFKVTATGFFERIQTLRWSDIADKWQDMNFRWNDRFFLAAFPFNLLGDVNGNIYTLSTADTHDGTAYPSFVTFPRRGIGDMRSRNLVKRVYPFAERLPGATYGLTVTTAVYDRVGGSATGTAVQTYDLTQAGKHFVNPYKRGRLAQVQFGTNGPNQPWILDGYDMDVVAGGDR